jgi:catechol 2,3-dioxygenase-like lactoylglutathione lyase family enzyme
MTISRRHFVLSLPALSLAPRALFAQRTGPTIAIRGINHVGLMVSDLKRSTEFYQSVFGMPLRRADTISRLQVGNGPIHLELLTAAAGAAPTINHCCLGVEGFDVDRITKALADRGVAKSETAGPMTMRVTARAAGGSSIRLGDPDGIDIQLQAADYCGGSGPLGAVCTAAEPAAKKGAIALKGYSHITVFSSDPAKSNAFYQDVFGLGIRSYQGPTAPTLAAGPGVEFLMFTGGGGGRAGASARPASINHFCMSLENFKPDDILKTLETFGIKPRESQTGPVGPMRHYISMRMENRGGAKEGTPELYFTDPDGLLVQLQDVKYCGGSGFLGDACPRV